ncbi:hypothetical protein JYG50_24985, partial [Escherichia fergusonii]|nr:hypothetical protein [Escherichia fergusonii]
MVRDKNPIRNRIYGCTYPFYYITEESIAFRERPYMLPRARPLGFTEMLCSDRYFGNKVEDYVVT